MSDDAARRRGLRAATAAVLCVAVVAFAAYRATLLPGLDFGDTAAFQDAGGQIDVTPRQAYPLYFALGNLVVWTVGGEPAHGMNLASALWGAAACGVVTGLAIALTGSALAGSFTGLLWLGSYTFWSQAVIAEVYTLHILMLAASLSCLVWWSNRPASLGRLACFFAVYALGFGNHLMMVLLMPAAIVFLALNMPGGVRGLLRGRVMALAVALAAAGALQYAWNLREMWASPVPPASVAEALRTFWFDVTKTDWRSTMVLGVHESALRARLGLYWFELHQQFGTPAVALAIVGIIALAVRCWKRATLFAIAYLVATAFAYTYNVGDAHVFFLPSHLFVALAAGYGVLALAEAAARVCSGSGVGRIRTRAAESSAGSGFSRIRTREVAALLLLAALLYPAWRVYDTWPAVDRSGDTRPQALLNGLAGDLSPERTLLVADLNWQLQNGLDYYARHVRPELAYLHGVDRVMTLPWLIAANQAIGREVLVTDTTARVLREAYGPLFTIEPDDRAAAAPLADRLTSLDGSLVYAIALLRPYPDVPFDAAELDAAIRRLTGGTATMPHDGVYTVMAGHVGGKPLLVRSERRPFRTKLSIDGLALDIRMESWLPPDTMRRAGFGHVIANRAHVLTLERGVSLVTLAPDGRVVQATYASGLFAPLRRYVVKRGPAA